MTTWLELPCCLLSYHLRHSPGGGNVSDWGWLKPKPGGQLLACHCHLLTVSFTKTKIDYLCNILEITMPVENVMSVPPNQGGQLYYFRLILRIRSIVAICKLLNGPKFFVWGASVFCVFVVNEYLFLSLALSLSSSLFYRCRGPLW